MWATAASNPICLRYVWTRAAALSTPIKKVINRPENAVGEMAEGLLAIHPNLSKLAGHEVILRADLIERWGREVALISGGGSGHEPAHAGFVGRGMLTAAVLGQVFTSPNVSSVYAAIEAAAGPAGALLIVK